MFCCFGRAPAPAARAPQQPQAPAHPALGPEPCSPDAQNAELPEAEFNEALQQLRVRVISLPVQTWEERVTDGTAIVLNATGAALISVLGCVHDVSEGRCAPPLMVALHSAGTAAAVLPPGAALSLPHGFGATSGATTLPPWAHPPALNGRGPAYTGLGLDDGWRNMLLALDGTCPAACKEWHTLLLPLALGGQMFGALLVVLPGAPLLQQLQDKEAAKAECSGRDSSGLSDGVCVPLLRTLLHKHGALDRLGQAVMECIVGPVYAQLEQVCVYAGAAFSARTLLDLSAALTTAVASSLAAELHLEPVVRLAVLPYKEARTGVLFEWDVRSALNTQPRSEPSPQPQQRGIKMTMQEAPAPASLPTPGSRKGQLHNSRGAPASEDTGTSAAPPPPVSSAESRWGGRVLQAAAPSFTRRQIKVSPFPLRATLLAALMACADSRHGSGPGGTSIAGGGPGGAGPVSSGRGGGGTGIGGRVGAGAVIHSGRGSAGAVSSGPVGAGPASNGRGGARASNYGAAAGTSARLGAPVLPGADVLLSPPRAGLLRAGAVVADVHSYLQGSDFPTVDVFTAFRGVGGSISSPPPTSLVIAAGWASGAFPSGDSLYSPGRVREAFSQHVGPTQRMQAQLSPNASTEPASMPASAHLLLQSSKRPPYTLGGGGGGAGHSTGTDLGLTPTASSFLVPYEQPPAPVFAVYLGFHHALPPALLAVARARVMGLLQVLLPLAMRALCGAVQDEWLLHTGQLGNPQPSGGAAALASATSITLGNLADQGPNKMPSPRVADVRQIPLNNASRGTGSGFTGDLELRFSASPRAYAAGGLGAPAPPSEEHQAKVSLSSRSLNVAGAGGRGHAAHNASIQQPTSPAQRAISGGGGHMMDTNLSTLSLSGLDDTRASSGGGAAAAPLYMSSLLTTTPDESRRAVKHTQLDVMVNTVQATLARARAETINLTSTHADNDIRSLRLVKTLGQGAYSVVVLGRLHAMPVAVKVILPMEEEASSEGHAHEHPDARRQSAGPGGGAEEAGAKARPVISSLRQRQQRMMLRGARELAVMTALSHPNIVQVYSYCTRVLVVPGPSAVPQLKVVPEGSAVSESLCTALIMEFCDMGSLADAIDNGNFARAAKMAAASLTHSRGAQSASMARADRKTLQTQMQAQESAPRGAAVAGAPVPLPTRLSSLAPPTSSAATAGTPALRAVYLTLLEVALALRHLHAQNLVHCDVKPANVLLRSSATDPRGFTAKLTDFGFVNVLEQRRTESELEPAGDVGPTSNAAKAKGFVQFKEPVGTVTHMSPELFIQGVAVDSSIDVYAFGILMWELYTGRAPYAEFADSGFQEVPHKVVREGLRPRFPADAPLHFKLLAQECWSSTPTKRPAASALVARLQQLLDVCCAQGQIVASAAF